MRIHLATHDTCHAERVNTAIGDAVVDGGLLKCDYCSVFGDMSDEEISALSNEQIEELEKSAAGKNAWSCNYDIALRVDEGQDLMGQWKATKQKKKMDCSFTMAST